MVTTDSKSKTSTHSPARQIKKTLSSLPADEPVLTKVREGTKKGIEGYLEPKNLLTPEEAQAWVQKGGNYAFRLGHETSSGWMLAILDVEVKGALSEATARWVDEHALAEFETLHGGSNRLLKTTLHGYKTLNGAPTKIDLDGDGEHELELLAPSRGHALGPGSIVEHHHCGDTKPCNGTGEGQYHLEALNPDAPTVDETASEELLELLDIDPAEGSGGLSATKDKDSVGETESSGLDPDVRRRLQRAENFAFGDEFVALKEGRYDDAGFPDDRSAAEYRLVEILGWLFDDDKAVVRRAMDVICRSNPRTTVRRQEKRKWLERNGNYRENTLSNACDHDSTYDPRTLRSYNSRPEVSGAAKSKVFESLLDLGLASSQEIADHEIIDWSQRQVRRALRKQRSDIQSVKDGRQRLYYVDPVFIPPDERDEHNL